MKKTTPDSTANSPNADEDLIVKRSHLFLLLRPWIKTTCDKPSASLWTGSHVWNISPSTFIPQPMLDLFSTIPNAYVEPSPDANSKYTKLPELRRLIWGETLPTKLALVIQSFQTTADIPDRNSLYVKVIQHFLPSPTLYPFSKALILTQPEYVSQEYHRLLSLRKILFIEEMLTVLRKHKYVAGAPSTDDQTFAFHMSCFQQILTMTRLLIERVHYGLRYNEYFCERSGVRLVATAVKGHISFREIYPYESVLALPPGPDHDQVAIAWQGCEGEDKFEVLVDESDLMAKLAEMGLDIYCDEYLESVWDEFVEG